ncbi:MAG TPA: acetate--CoA ligase family protein [Thermoanaerobaculia bacterium]|nr:acetate--CoA ligase family protein [Thermoanaerobaculia bacterium]
MKSHRKREIPRPEGLDAIFRPRAIAVVGASTRPHSIGGNLLSNLFRSGFTGKIFPINPRASVLHSVKCYASVLDVPDEIDCAIISVPKEGVLGVVSECAKKGIRGLVVITAGFKEVGPDGAELERQLVELVRKKGMRMIGPNCMGVINAEPEYAMDATFSPTPASYGPLAFASQSGALGVAILNVAQALKLGFTQFVSMGNKANISSNDMLGYWENDPRTRIIALYLESFGNPRRFVELTRRITKKKPVLVVKSGRTVAGARAASSHTGALAASEVAIDAVLEACGVSRSDTIEELFDLASALTSQPLPKGDRVAILTNAGGPAIMATDAVIQQGLRLAELSARTKRRLAAFLPSEASLGNPVDMIASASDVNYGRAAKILLEDRGVDSVLVINVTPVLYGPRSVWDALMAATRGAEKPVLSVFMANEEFYDEARSMPAHPPIYRFPEPAARVLAEMWKIGRWQKKPRGTFRRFRMRTETIRKIIARRRRRGGGYLDPDDAFSVLAAAGIPAARPVFVRRESLLASAAQRVGYPVVLKAAGEKIVHKSDVGGVATGIRDAAELREALARMKADLARHGAAEHLEGYILQREASGRELVAGATNDPRIGPLVMFGLGGRYVEIFKDVKFVLPPVSREEVLEALDKLKAGALLSGVRGEPAGDREFLVEAILRVCQLVTDFPEISEMDVNPLFVSPKGRGGLAVDVRIRVSGREPGNGS